MTEKESILQLLYFYPADYISADTFSKKLGVQKSKIYAFINELRLEGYKIDGCTNRGYKLASAEDDLSAESIVKFCSLDKEKIRIFSTLPSTNSTAKEMASLGAPEGTVCIAKRQTNGKGRMERKFFSPDQTGIYMSIILRPNLSPEDALQITTLSAVAVAESIEEFTCEPAQIKWVNDIYFKNKKVCGILAESSLNSKTGALDYIVLGIGINLFQPSGGFPKAIENIAGAIFDKPFKDARSSFIGSVLTRFYAYYNKIEEKTFLTEYKKRSLLTGKSVTVNTFTSSYPATVLSINDDFSLRLLLPDGTEKTLSTGEVSVKLK